MIEKLILKLLDIEIVQHLVRVFILLGIPTIMLYIANIFCQYVDKL